MMICQRKRKKNESLKREKKRKEMTEGVFDAFNDLSRMHNKFINEDRIVECELQTVLDDYQRFFISPFFVDQQTSVLNDGIRKVWTRHMLDTVLYHQHCGKVHGNNAYLHSDGSVEECMSSRSSVVVGLELNNGEELLVEKRKRFIMDELNLKGLGVDENPFLESEYRKWLVMLLMTEPLMGIIPSAAVDEVWHTHVLQSKRYMKDCEEMFGGYQHHVPK